MKAAVPHGQRQVMYLKQQTNTSTLDSEEDNEKHFDYKFTNILQSPWYPLSNSFTTKTDKRKPQKRKTQEI